MQFNVRKEASVQFTAVSPVFSLGWILAFLVLFLTIVFLVFGMPDPKTPLFLIGALALARLL